MANSVYIPTLYHDFIEWIGDGTGLSDTILHIHAGMAVLIAARVISGRGLGTFTPWLWVVIAEAGNEILDRLHFGSWRWPDTTSDLLNTLLWPTILSVAIRVRPLLTRAPVDAKPLERDNSAAH